MRRGKRSAYTLLEVMLSLLIGTMLLAALYSAVGYQLRQSQAGRDVVGQTTLTRSITSRLENDILAAVALADSSRFRVQADQEAQQQQQSGMGGTGGTGMATDMADMGDMPPNNGLMQPAVIPLGVMGDSTTLTLFATKVPGEVYGVRAGESGQLVSDIRRISYWLGEGGAGLCRQEIRIATAEEALNPELPTGDVASYLLAPEVKSIEFRYFDGTDWLDSWDSTELGDDEVTPKGSPRAIEVRIGVLPPGQTTEGEGGLKYYRHTVAIPTANGITQADNGAGTPP